MAPRRLSDAARWAVILTLLTALYVAAFRPDTLASDYFLGQDLALLLVGAGALACLARFAGRGTPLQPLAPWQAAGAVLAAALVAWAGCSLVMERFGASRDEQIAELAAGYFQRGLPGLPIPPALWPFRFAMLPIYADVRGGWWVSFYYPLNSVLRAAAGWLLGDRWLAGPLLLALGLAGLWRAGRVVWPERREAPTVTLLLGLSSTQLLANAMTSYAMTAQFALEAWWIAAVAARSRRAQGAAAVLGLLSTGIHQAHFHPQFAIGIIIWLWLSGRRRDAVFQVLAVALAWAVWDQLYRHVVLDHIFGPGAAVPVTEHLGYFGRLLDVDPLPSIARFVAWQNVLLAPLALLAARAGLRERPYPPTWGMAVSCAIGLLVTVDSVHTLGCRYLTGLIPCFCLLGADGWHRLGQGSAGARGHPLGATLLWGSVAFAALVTAPFALWRSHAMIHPYAEAYRAARAAPADVVLVDPRDAAFLQDVVRFDDPAQRPLLLDLPKVPMTSLPALCRGRVMILDRRQARALGMAARSTQTDADKAAPRRAWLARAGCGVPVPLPG